MRNHLLLSALLLLSVASCSPKTETVIKPVLPLQPEAIPALLTSFVGEKAVLVNVWATWCVPCVEEFPYLVRLREEFKDQVEVVFISADFPDQLTRVETFLQEQNVDWQTYINDGKDEPFILAIHPDWTGAMPATVVYDKNGRLITFFERPADYDTFKTHIHNAIKP